MTDMTADVAGDAFSGTMAGGTQGSQTGATAVAAAARDQVRQSIPPWIPILASLAIVAGIGICVFLVVQGNPILPPAFFLTLFLLLFALGTLTGMLFITSERFQATTGAFSLMIGGPAAIWFGGTLVIMLTPIYGKLFEPYKWPQTIAALENTILDIERSAGWTTYKDWKAKNRDYHQQVVDEERALLSELLESAFTFSKRPPNEARSLLRSPRISTAFLYFPKFIVKFQAISGAREEDSEKTDIFYDSRATDGESASTALVCATSDATGNLRIRRDNVEILRNPDSRGWQTVRGDTVNCLLAARYNDSGRTRKQDRILVDMKRFTNDQSAGGSIDLAVLNYQYPVARGSVMWQMKGSVGTSKPEVPLVFRSYDAPNLGSLFSHQKDGSGHDDPRYAIKIRQEISAWLRRIDQYLNHDPAEFDKMFFQTLKVAMATELRGLNLHVDDSPTLEQLFVPPSVGVSAFHVGNATNVSIAFVKPEL